MEVAYCCWLFAIYYFILYILLCTGFGCFARRTVRHWLVFQFVSNTALGSGATFFIHANSSGVCVTNVALYVYVCCYVFMLYYTMSIDTEYVITFRMQNCEDKVGHLSDLNGSSTATISAEVEWSVPLFDFKELTIDKKLGAGGFGEVYKATHNGQSMAAKRLMASARDTKDGFKKEINILLKLNHENIVKLHGVCIHALDQYILLELAELGSVYGYIHGKGGRDGLSREFVYGILLDTAKGMNYLHSFHPAILHRDLKSQNLLLFKKDATATTMTTKLCDFGLSRVKSLSKTMSRIGTVQWVAPEVLRGERYSEKADVYAYGVVCWELVTRKIPWRDEGFTAKRIANRVARGSHLKIPVDTPKALQDLMNHCWLDPGNLRPTFGVFIIRLEKILNPNDDADDDDDVDGL